MTAHFLLIVSVGLLSFPFALLSTFAFLRSFNLLGAFAMGVLLFVAGWQYGIDQFCLAQPSAGNLCGLGALLGTGPLGFSAGLLGYLAFYRTLRRFVA